MSESQPDLVDTEEVAGSRSLADVWAAAWRSFLGRLWAVRAVAGPSNGDQH